MSARPAIHKGSPRLKFSFVPTRKQSVRGGLPVIEALAQEFGLWDKLHALRRLDPRVCDLGERARGRGAVAVRRAGGELLR